MIKVEQARELLKWTRKMLPILNEEDLKSILKIYQDAIDREIALQEHEESQDEQDNM